MFQVSLVGPTELKSVLCAALVGDDIRASWRVGVTPHGVDALPSEVENLPAALAPCKGVILSRACPPGTSSS